MILEALDVIEHVGLGLDSRAEGRTRRAFNFQGRALHRRIVPEVASPAHTAGNAVVGQGPLEWLTGVLASPIGVMQHGLGLAPPPDGRHDRIGDELRRHRRAHRPADLTTREEIHDSGHIEPACGGPDVGQVRDPFAARRRGIERAGEHIGGHRVRRSGAGVRGNAPSSRAASQGLAPHQPLDSMPTTRDPIRQQVIPERRAP